MWYDLGAILELRVFQELLGQQVVNVQHYRVESHTTGVPSLSWVCQSLGQAFVEAMGDFQSTALTYTQAQIAEVGGIDIASYTFIDGEAGLITGDCSAPFVSYGIRQNRTTRLTRHGQKRIAGVPENYVTAGEVPSVHVIALRAAAASIWDGFVTVSDVTIPTNHVVLAPIIWGGFDALYPDGRFNYISGITVNPAVTTQNSRKFGRGA